MTERDFWIAMRACILGIAGATEDEVARRHLLGMAATIATRYGLGERLPENVTPLVARVEQERRIGP